MDSELLNQKSETCHSVSYRPSKILYFHMVCMFTCILYVSVQFQHFHCVHTMWYELSWVQLVLCRSCPRYELLWFSVQVLRGYPAMSVTEVTISNYATHIFSAMPLSSESIGICEMSAQQTAVTHYNDVIMSAMASQITSLAIVYSNVYSGADKRKHQSSASLAFVWEIHRWPVNSRTKGQWRGKYFHLMTSSWHGKKWCIVAIFYH